MWMKIDDRLHAHRKTRAVTRSHAGAHHDRFGSIRYPRPSLPGYATRERAEQVREAMPDPGNFEIEEVND